MPRGAYMTPAVAWTKRLQKKSGTERVNIGSLSMKLEVQIQKFALLFFE